MAIKIIMIITFAVGVHEKITDLTLNSLSNGENSSGIVFKIQQSTSVDLTQANYISSHFTYSNINEYYRKTIIWWCTR